jgi:lipoteichoic acid synthase
MVTLIAQLRNAIRRLVSDRKNLLFLLFIGFVLLNAYKTAVFNRLIVDSSAFPRWDDLAPGLLNKFFFINALCLILLRFRLRFPIIVFYVLQSLYFAINLIYYFSFQGYLHISQYLGLFSEAFDLMTHAAMPWDARALLVLIDLPLLVAVLLFYPRLADINKRYLFKPVMYGSSILFLVYFYQWEIPVETPLRTMNNAYASDVSVVEKYGLLTFNLMDLFNYRDAQSHIKGLNYGPAYSSPDTTGEHPNILIIQVESLDANAIDYKYKKEYVTPFLHRLSNECVFFPYMLSYHLAGGTSDCEFSTINSVEPFDNFPSVKLRNYDYPNSLVKRCTADGYSVFACHGNRGEYFNRKSAFKKMGFQNFFDLYGMGVPEVGWGATDESVLDFVKAQASREKQPFFGYAITMSSHEPFIFVTPYFHKKAYDGIQDGAKRNYLNSIAYVDKVLSKFIPDMRSAFPNTVIVIYGDHAPITPRAGYSKAVFTLDQRIFEFVPLFILTPEKTVYRETSYVASFLDIAPTVMAAAKCTGKIRTLGLNLLAPPLHDKDIPLRLGIYSRKELFSKIAHKK